MEIKLSKSQTAPALISQINFVSSFSIVFQAFNMAGQVAILRMRACLVLLLLCLTEDQQASASETVRSFYDTLNVERTASDTQIKKSFRSLAVRYHPDKNKSAQAETTFREIAEGKRCCNTLASRCHYMEWFSPLQQSIRAERLCVRI